MIDLDTYSRRVGYDGPRDTSLETLRQLHYLHPQAIAFEDLGPPLGRPVKLDPVSLQDHRLSNHIPNSGTKKQTLASAAETLFKLRLDQLEGRDLVLAKLAAGCA